MKVVSWYRTKLGLKTKHKVKIKHEPTTTSHSFIHSFCQSVLLTYTLYVHYLNAMNFTQPLILTNKDKYILAPV